MHILMNMVEVRLEDLQDRTLSTLEKNVRQDLKVSTVRKEIYEQMTFLVTRQHLTLVTKRRTRTLVIYKQSSIIAQSRWGLSPMVFH